MNNEILEIIKELNFTSMTWEILTPICFSVGDIITGYIQAMINHNVDSQKMRTGLLHKILIILVIILSIILQKALNIEYISKFICLYVVFMEITSILENLKKAGINIGKLGEILKAKSDNNINDNLGKIVKTLEKEEFTQAVSDDLEFLEEEEK